MSHETILISTLAFMGFVVLGAKALLIEHYEESPGAKHFRGLRMFIDTNDA